MLMMLAAWALAGQEGGWQLMRMVLGSVGEAADAEGPGPCHDAGWCHSEKRGGSYGAAGCRRPDEVESETAFFSWLNFTDFGSTAADVRIIKSSFRSIMPLCLAHVCKWNWNTSLPSIIRIVWTMIFGHSAAHSSVRGSSEGVGFTSPLTNYFDPEASPQTLSA